MALARKRTIKRSLPSWDDVRFFLAIHRAGSLSAAAGPLNVTQPTCGRRLAALEKSLEMILFNRTPEGLRITAEGESLLDAAIAMEQHADDIALSASVNDRDLAGVVRIATTEMFASEFLVGALTAMRRKFPGIHVELVLSTAASDLLRGEADIAIRFRPHGMRPTPESLVASKLGDEPHRLYGAESYVSRRGIPEDPCVLVGHDVVLYSDRSPSAEWCARAFRGANIVLSSTSMTVTAEGIAAGLGLGVIPARAANAVPQLRALSGVVAKGTAWLVVHPELRRVPRIRVAADLITALYRADEQTLSAKQ